MTSTQFLYSRNSVERSKRQPVNAILNADKSSRLLVERPFCSYHHHHHPHPHHLSNDALKEREPSSLKMSSNESKTDVPPKVDLVLVFRSGLLQPSSKYTSKQEIKENALAAQSEYEKLLSKLQAAGFHATGRRGQKNGQLLVLIWAPSSKVVRMVQRERCASVIIFFFCDLLKHLKGTPTFCVVCLHRHS